MKRYPKIYLYLLKHSLIWMMEFRSDFLLRALPTSLTLVTNLLAVVFLLGRINLLAGWNRDQILLLLGTYYIVWGLFFGTFIQNLSKVNSYVNRGDLDLFLSKPIDSQFYISFHNHIDFGEMATIIIGIFLLISSSSRLAISPHLDQLMLYLLLILNSVVVAYSLWFITVTFSFWFGRLPDIHEAFLSLFSFNKYPIDIFQYVLRVIFTFMIPLAVIVTFPTNLLMSKLNLTLLLWSFGMGITSIVASHLFWNFALRRYSSASS